MEELKSHSLNCSAMDLFWHESFVLTVLVAFQGRLLQDEVP